MSEVIIASPNEAEAIRLEEFRRMRLQRLLQVRNAERQRSKLIRSNAEEQVALAKEDLKAKVTREVNMEFKQAVQSARQRLRSAESSVGESMAAAQQHQEVLAVEARADYEALSRSVHVAAQRHQAAVHVEASISSLSPSAVVRQRAQHMADVRREAAQESVSWASSRPPVQPKCNEMPKPSANRRHKPADASAFHTSHHHFGSALLYPHSSPIVQVVRHPRSSADATDNPSIIHDDSSATAAASSSTRQTNISVGRGASAHHSHTSQSLQSTRENSSNSSRIWPQPRGTSPFQADDDHPHPLPAPQPRMPAVTASSDKVNVADAPTRTQVNSADATSRTQVNSAHATSQHESWNGYIPQEIHHAAGRFVPSAESSFEQHTASSVPAAPAALPLKLVSGDGRLTMSATEIAHRIAELHRVRAIQEEAKLLKQEATVLSRGRNAAAFLRDQSEAKKASAAVEQVIKHAEQTRRQAARVIAPPPGFSNAANNLPENVREKAFGRLVLQCGAAQRPAPTPARALELDSGACLRSANDISACDAVAQPLPSSLSLRGAILRDSAASTIPGSSISHAPREIVVPADVSEASVVSPSKNSVSNVDHPVSSDSDSSSDSLELKHSQSKQCLSDSSSDSDDLWPPRSSAHTTEIPFPNHPRLQPSMVSNVKISHGSTAENADDVLMSDTSSTSTSTHSSPIHDRRTASIPFASSQQQLLFQKQQQQQDRQMQQPHPSRSAALSTERPRASFDAESLLQSRSPKSKPSQVTQVKSVEEIVNSTADVSQQSRPFQQIERVHSAPALIASTTSDIHPEHSATAPSPTRVPVSPARARVRVLLPAAPLSPEPVTVIRSPPASNVSTPSDLQSPSLLQHVNLLRDLRSSPTKGVAFHTHNSSFGEAVSLAAMDDYSARGSIDEKLQTRLSADTWMRLSAARSSIASLEVDSHERNIGTSAWPPQTVSEVDAASEGSLEEDIHESIAETGECWACYQKKSCFSLFSCSTGVQSLTNHRKICVCCSSARHRAYH
jgi:hypothetical protein